MHDGCSSTEGYWEDPAQVARFAEREADLRLSALQAAFADPARVRVLDLGCAGGRNAAFLAARGFDVHALDASAAMVAHTRARVAAVLGAPEADRRVQQGRMDDLGRYPAAHFDLVVALGIYHCARSGEEWRRAVAETVRVLAPAGLLLVSHFTPRTDIAGRGVEPVPGEPHLYRGFDSGLHYLLESGELDAAMASHGLRPEAASQTVARATEKGQRVTVNALYRRAPAAVTRAPET